MELSRCERTTIVNDFYKLGKYIVVTFDTSTKSFIFKKDKKEWFYEKREDYISDPVYKFNYKMDNFDYMNHNLKLVLLSEKKLISKLNIDNSKVNVRLSGNLLRMSKIYNSSAIIITKNVKNYVSKFKEMPNETVVGMSSIPINYISNKLIDNFVKNIHGVDINMKHHLESCLKLQDKWNKNNIFDDYHLIIIKEFYDDQYFIDIPGGKRQLGETSLKCVKRETNEETGFNFLSCKIKPINKINSGYMNYYVFLL